MFKDTMLKSMMDNLTETEADVTPQWCVDETQVEEGKEAAEVAWEESSDIDDSSSSDDSDFLRSTQRANITTRRILERNLPFHQSKNTLSIGNHNKSALKKMAWFIYHHDWFHLYLRLPTYASVLIFLSLWTSMILVFAGLYIAIDKSHPGDCGLSFTDDDGSIKYGSAFAFSLETTTTVGYGLPGDSNAFFENCPSVQVCIYFHMVLSMMFNAFLFSFFFARLSRCEQRAIQVIFSDKAIVKREFTNGGICRYKLDLRTYDIDSSHPIVEAHVRIYAIKHTPLLVGVSSNEGYHDLKFDPMRVESPNDELGAMLYISAPHIISHHIGMYSPICPPEKKAFAEGGRVPIKSGFVVDSAGFRLRELDSHVETRTGLQCTVCGETYGTYKNLVRHIEQNKRLEANDGVPIIDSHQELNVQKIFKRGESYDRCHSSYGIMDDSNNENAGCYDQFKKHFKECNLEILVIIEGIDPMMSGTFQAMQSYAFEDIVYGGEFAPCMLSDQQEGIAKVDLKRFHKIVR
mmetsp:Transcript_29065/g.53176  ORF Transcript_29065/g.53176 Transcript_29065/m.53176 type:complete len:519 (-) Transcript_29065:119-1675(-)